MKSYKRIIAGFLAIATLSVNIITASAELSSEPDKVSFWVRWMHAIAVRSDGMKVQDIPVGRFLAAMVSDMSHGTVCELSDDHWHHADESDYVKVSEGKDGTYGVRAKCKYCHKEFAVGGLTADDLSSKYNDYVSNLPASGYTSAGGLLWQPRWIEDTSTWKLTAWFDSANTPFIGPAVDGYVSSVGRVTATANGSAITAVVSDGAGFPYFSAMGGAHSFRVPVTGQYYALASDFVSGVFVTASHTKYELAQSWKTASFGYYTANSLLNVSSIFPSPTKGSAFFSFQCISGNACFSAPIFRIVPDTSSSTTINNIYNINTRVNNFNGDYYDSVTNNYYNNTTIINETTNNYYDMTTNNYYTMSNWSYDYQSRTYFVTLEDGTTITVQFGDDCLTITNNNVENSYQYVIKNGGSSPDTPAACKHNWTETIDVAPTCLEGGHANYTCSLCGETYEQILSAKGHNWTVKEHVNTVYGENGQIVTQGHTLYECSACGEQWYTETAAPPPDVSGGGTIISWLTNFQTWLGDMLSVGLTVNLGSIVDKLQVLIDNSTSTVENTIVDIAVDSDAYNVFYVTDGDGNAQPVTEFAGDLTTASGKLLSLLYRLVFSGALETVDDDLDNFEDFFTSEEPVEETASQNMDNAANEVIDVWGS